MTFGEFIIFVNSYKLSGLIEVVSLVRITCILYILYFMLDITVRVRAASPFPNACVHCMEVL